MREVLFRGKRIDNGEWVYGDLCHGEYGKVFILHDNDAVITSKKNELTSWGFIEVDPETIGQYAGLKGRNGNKIFEGDIFILGDLNIKHIVVWHDNSFMGKQSRTKGSMVGLTYWEDRIEIIGNIHDEEE